MFVEIKLINVLQSTSVIEDALLLLHYMYLISLVTSYFQITFLSVTSTCVDVCDEMLKSYSSKSKETVLNITLK